MKNNKVRNSILLLIVITMLSFTSAAFAGNYWVSPSGTASWSACKSTSPLSGTSACLLSTANTNALAGDTINIRAGTYNTSYIKPSNSGTSGSKITWQAYNGETVIITDGAYGIYLNGKDYHIINGVTITNTTSLLVLIDNGSDYNEIKNCDIFKGPASGHSGFMIMDTNLDNNGSNHNWVHHNVIYQAGYITTVGCQDQGRLFDIATDDVNDGLSNHNTIEDNVMYWGGHFIFRTHTSYNVIRNNVFHNESWMEDAPGDCTPAMPADTNGKWGNRNLQILDNIGVAALYNLIEGNRSGHAGLPPDGGGADNYTLTAPGNIMRYNVSYNAAQRGLFFKQAGAGDSDNNRVYNNTFYHSGYVGPLLNNTDGIWIHPDSDNNVIKNNIIYDSYKVDIGGETAGNTVSNNWVKTNGDPLFANTNISDPMSTTLPDLSLKAGSGAINGGTYLTQANGAGTNSTTLIVDDALFFQDGSWGSSLSNIAADYIAIGTVGNTVQISSINYSTNTITLAAPMTWSDKAKIWLYKDSSGKIVLMGSAPDIGAYEFAQPAAPTSSIIK